MKVSIALFFGSLSLAGMASQAHAQNLTQAQAVQVTGIEGSRSATNGYFAITTANAVGGCEAGFWLPITDKRYATYLARVNDALLTKAPIMVAGDRDQLMPDSSEKVCRIARLQ